MTSRDEIFKYINIIIYTASQKTPMQTFVHISGKYYRFSTFLTAEKILTITQ